MNHRSEPLELEYSTPELTEIPTLVESATGGYNFPGDEPGAPPEPGGG